MFIKTLKYKRLNNFVVVMIQSGQDIQASEVLSHDYNICILLNVLSIEMNA